MVAFGGCWLILASLFCFGFDRYTELEIAVPDIGIVGLHAENLGIESVLVDGDPTEFEYYPHNYQNVESCGRWSSVTTPSSAADAAGSAYVSALERELVPNLLINCCKAFKTGSELQELPVLENGVQQSSGEANQVAFAIYAFKELHVCVSLQFLLLHSLFLLVNFFFSLFAIRPFFES